MTSEADTLERWFTIADANRDGRIDGREAITFFSRSGLSRETLKEVWARTAGEQSFMSKQQFYGAIRLVSLAQLSGGRFEAHQAQQLLTGMSPPPPLPKLSGLTSGVWSGDVSSPTDRGSASVAPTRQFTGGSLTGGPAVQVTGQVPMQYTGGRLEAASYPPLPAEEAGRYFQLFQSLDTDRDGLLQGGQCIELFSSRGVDKPTLKHIWSVVAGNSGHVNKDQFIQCLYFIELAKKGMRLPAALPPGPFPSIVQGTQGYVAPQPGYGPGGMPALPTKAVFQSVEHPAYPGWRGPAANESMVSTLDPSQRDRLMAEKTEALKKDQELYKAKQEAETAKSKKEFYEKALQELMLFKSRMDGVTMNVQEELRREQEQAADIERRYEQIRMGAEEAAREAGSAALALQESQKRKSELEAKLDEMQQDLAVKERSHPETVHRLELEIQVLQESVAAVEQRRNTIAAELESYKHQQDLLHRRQGDLQMAVAAAEAEVHSASGDIAKIMAEVDSVKQSKDVEQIQKLLRESARVYSNLHSHALKAGVEIPVEARLSLYGDDVTWTDDLIGAGIDIAAWQEDGFVLVDAFPDVKEDMDAEFEKAIQEAVSNIEKNATSTLPQEYGFSTDLGGDPFSTAAAQVTKHPSTDFVAFDAFPSQEAPVASQTPSSAFPVSFEAAVPQSTTKPEKTAFVAFDDPMPPSTTKPSTESTGFATAFDDIVSQPAVKASTEPVGFTAFETPEISSGFDAQFPTEPVTTDPSATSGNKDGGFSSDLFGDSAFP